jgi:urea transporter
MFQDSEWTGLFFLIGIFFGSFIAGVAAVISVIAGTLTAKLLRYSEVEINSGLYGFSATLVVVVLVFYSFCIIFIYRADHNPLLSMPLSIVF